jgi:hypothetical protein
MREEVPAARMTALTGALIEIMTALFLNRPDVLLRWEGLFALVVGCLAYQRIYTGHGGLFAVLFLAPDIALLAYMVGKGSAAFYNLLHTYVLPLCLGVWAWKSGSAPAGEVALIWMAHISFDRWLGYGLKYPGVFRYTHIQRSASLEQTAVLK